MGTEKQLNNSPILSVPSVSIFTNLQTVLLGVLAYSLKAITSIRLSVRKYQHGFQRMVFREIR